MKLHQRKVMKQLHTSKMLQNINLILMDKPQTTPYVREEGQYGSPRIYNLWKRYKIQWTELRL